MRNAIVILQMKTIMVFVLTAACQYNIEIIDHIRSEHVIQPSVYPLMRNSRVGRQCTGGLNTHCTPPKCLEGYERTLAISWK